MCVLCCLSVHPLSYNKPPPYLVSGCGYRLGPERSNLNKSATRFQKDVIHKGQTGSNPYRLSYGSDTELVESSSRCKQMSLDADNFEGQFNVTSSHPWSHGVSLLYEYETVLVESFCRSVFWPVSGQFKVVWTYN